ncbi:MAG: hypothetical protein ING73_03830 [Rhodocyclaceae bacterium]|nr:hypothetical protein [Rhodocyclaceae bacterium]MCA3047754.1 hypothetical protein [Rhodocyclaceae bacterium]MCA3051229.1 hypothetical protein [Rhodocyclaceae bacterium]MCA3057840.1 hypothetical protein [Rhodocyclaceae bacterium]MCA3061330.1 hypothetical protein [Rhodocyclaceae bacterium]
MNKPYDQSEIVEKLLGCYQPSSQTYVFPCDCLGGVNKSPVATTVKLFFGDELIISSATKPTYDPVSQKVYVVGRVSFCPKGTAYAHEYPCQLWFMPRQGVEINLPSDWKLLLCMQISLNDWKLLDCFPALKGTPLENLDIKPRASSDFPGPYFTLASEDIEDHARLPFLRVPAGFCLFAAAVVKDVFPELHRFFPSTDPSELSGVIKFSEGHGVEFVWRFESEVACPEEKYPVAIYAELVATMLGASSHKALSANAIPNGYASIKLGIAFNKGTAKAFAVEGIYLRNTGVLALQYHDSPNTPLSLASLGGLFQDESIQDIPKTFPIPKWRSIESEAQVFRLSMAGIAFDLGVFAINSLSALVDLLPEQMAPNSTTVDLAIGSLKLERARLAINIAYPFSASRRISARVEAAVLFNNVELIAEADADGDLRLSLAEHATLPLRNVISRFTNIPEGEIPDLAFTDLSISVSLSTCALEMVGTIENWERPVGASAIRFEHSSAQFFLKGRAQDADSALFHGLIGATASVFGSTAKLSMSIADPWEFSVTVEKLRLSKLVQHLTGSSGPVPFVQDLEIAKLDMRFSPSHYKCEFSIDVFSEGAASGTAGPLRLSKGALRFSQVAENDWNLELRAVGSGSLADAFQLDESEIVFKYAKGTSLWEAHANIFARLFGHAITLKGDYAREEGADKLVLAVQGDIPPLKFDEANLTLSDFSCTIHRTAEGISCSTSASGRFALEGHFDIQGSLKFDAGSQSQGVRFVVSSGGKFGTELFSSGSLKPRVDVSVGEISIKRDGKGWSGYGEAKLLTTGLPDYVYLHGIVPAKEIDVYLSATANGLSLRFPGELVGTDNFVIPPIKVGDHEVNLAQYGPASIWLGDLELSLRRLPSMTCLLKVGLPEHLNRIFGEKDGKPAFELFEVRPHQTSLRFEIGYRGSTAGFFFSFETLPFAAKAVKAVNGAWQIDLGDCGSLVADVPMMSFSGGRFEFSGGARGLRTLRIPLSPLKSFLESIGASGMAQIIPKQPIPLPDIQVLGADGQINAAAFIAQLNEILPKAVTDPIAKGITEISNSVQSIPEPLKPYLNFSMVDECHFRFAIGGAACTELAVYAGDPNKPRTERKPLRIIFPVMVGPLPALQGVTFYGFSFGTLLGGSLFSLSVDADFDQFDLLSIALAAATPKSKYLPISRDFHRTAILDDLWMPVVYESGIPIPIPLFYKTLGVEFLGIEGISLQAHVAFPQPDADFRAFLALLLDFKRFISDPQHRLNPDVIPISAHLNFALSRCFIQLPEYLGGAVLGDRSENFVRRDLTNDIADLLNAIKFLQLSDVLKVLPEGVRKGEQAVSFGPIAFGAKWVVTDRLQSKQDAHSIGMPALHYSGLRTRVGLVGGRADESALEILLSGKCRVLSISELSVSFFYLAKNSQGFSTGFAISGQVGVLNYFGTGVVRVAENAAKERSNHIELVSELKFNQLTILSGTFVSDYSPNELSLKGDFRLLPPSFPFNLSSQSAITGSISVEGLAIRGQVVSTLGSVSLLNVEVVASRHSLFFDATVFSSRVRLTAAVQNDQLQLTGVASVPLVSLSMNVMINLQTKVGKFDLTGAIARELQLSIRGDLPHPTSTLRVSLFGVTMVEGHAVVRPDAFELGGTMNVFPPGSPLHLAPTVSGGINSGGFFIGGGGAIGFQVGPLGGISLSAGASVSSRGASVFAKAGINFLGIGASVGGLAGFGLYDRKVCFLAHLSGELWIWFFSVRVDLYIAVAPNRFDVSLSRPWDWPDWAVPPSLTATQMLPNTAGAKPSTPSSNKYTILEVVEQLSEQGVQQRASAQFENGDGSAMELAVAYGLAYRETPHDAETFAEATAVLRQVTLLQSNRSDDLIQRVKTTVLPSGIHTHEILGIRFDSVWQDGKKKSDRALLLGHDKQPLANGEIAWGSLVEESF